MQNAPQTLNLDGKETVIHNDGRTLMLKALMHLHEQGVGIFITTVSFTFHRGSISHLLGELGFNVEAALTLPSGTFSLFTANCQYFTNCRNKNKGKFFLESSRRIRIQKIVLHNLLQNKTGRVLQQGVWVDSSSDLSLSNLLKGEELKKITREYAYQWVTWEIK